MEHSHKPTSDRQLVVGVGSALMDILTHEDDEFLDQTGAAKGGMHYVDRKFIEAALTRASSSPKIVPGGSACNSGVSAGSHVMAALYGAQDAHATLRLSVGRLTTPEHVHRAVEALTTVLHRLQPAEDQK